MYQQDLNQMKSKIESMTKIHQIEILKIINKQSNVSINENKSGVFINLSFLESNVIEEIKNYLIFVEKQEQMLNPAETQKQDFKNTFFNDSNQHEISQNDDDMLTVYR